MEKLETKNYLVDSDLDLGVRVVDKETGEILKEDKNVMFEFISSGITGEAHLEITVFDPYKKYRVFSWENLFEELGNYTGDADWYYFMEDEEE